MANGFFFLASLGWNFGLGMTWLAVPLYAAAQGLSNAQIGVLLAAPVFVQVPLNLAGGIYTDRIGGRRIVLASCLMMALASLWLVVAHGFWMLLVGQVAFVVSRAAFWPATWAMASELPGSRGVQFGRLNAVTNFGTIAGTTLCGVLLAGTGFAGTFATLAGIALMSFLAGLGTATSAPKPQVAHPHPFAAYGPLLRRPIIHYSILCAYVSALPFSLAISFYPLLLANYGYGEESSGVLLALRALGSIGAGLVAGRFVKTGPETPWPVFCSVAVALSVGFLPVWNHPAPLAFWMLLVGLGSGAMTLYFQMTIAEASRAQERGSALALGGLGWSISHFTTPLALGFIADHLGMAAGFYALGVVGLACAVAIALLRRWAFAETIARPAVTPP
jgi:MFS family permease